MDHTTTNTIMDRLADVAWEKLATINPAALDLDEIAHQAAIKPHVARAAAGSVSQLILHQISRLDRQALLESCQLKSGRGSVPPSTPSQLHQQQG